ncbi:MAG: HAD-IIIA family hydrolase [Hyphomicrobium sp.]
MIAQLQHAECFDAEAGLWVETMRPPFARPTPALFIDRDGVLVEETHYLHRAADVSLIPGAAEVVARANRLGIPVIVVTNQAGIGKGLYDWTAFREVQDAIICELAARGATIDAVLACPYHEKGLGIWRHFAHPARKPKPGMLLHAAEMLNLDLAASWIVGDHYTDLLAGYAASLRGGMHVLTGRGAADRSFVASLQLPDFDLRLGESIRQADALFA